MNITQEVVLDIRELRVGNTIRLNIASGKFIEVDWAVLKQLSMEGNVPANPVLPMYLPVELDGEILFSLGFQWDDENPFIFLRGKQLMKRRRNGFFLMINNSKPYHKLPIRYLHQLQNVYFDLFGEDLKLG